MNIFANLPEILPYQLAPWQWAAWIGMGLCVGLSKAGFNGANTFLIPVIALIFGPKESTGVLLPVLCFTDILACVYYKRDTDWKQILRLLPWTLAGFGAAILAEKLVPVRAFKYLMGASILASLAVMIWSDLRAKDKTPPSAPWFSAIFGAAGGFSTTIGNAAGPLMSVYLLSMRLPKTVFAGTAAWFFLIVNYLKLPVQIFLWKNITPRGALFGLTIVPFVIAGLFTGIILIKKINEKIFRKVIMALTLVSTVFLFL